MRWRFTLQRQRKWQMNRGFYCSSLDDGSERGKWWWNTKESGVKKREGICEIKRKETPQPIAISLYCHELVREQYDATKVIGKVRRKERKHCIPSFPTNHVILILLFSLIFLLLNSCFSVYCTERKKESCFSFLCCWITKGCKDKDKESPRQGLKKNKRES